MPNTQTAPRAPQPLGSLESVPLSLTSPLAILTPGSLGRALPARGPRAPLLSAQSPSLTFLPVPVEDFDVFELDTDARSQGHRVCGIVFAPALDGAIGVSPEGRERQ